MLKSILKRVLLKEAAPNKIPLNKEAFLIENLDVIIEKVSILSPRLSTQKFASFTFNIRIRGISFLKYKNKLGKEVRSTLYALPTQVPYLTATYNKENTIQGYNFGLLEYSFLMDSEPFIKKNSYNIDQLEVNQSRNNTTVMFKVNYDGYDLPIPITGVFYGAVQNNGSIPMEKHHENIKKRLTNKTMTLKNIKEFSDGNAYRLTYADNDILLHFEYPQYKETNVKKERSLMIAIPMPEGLGYNKTTSANLESDVTDQVTGLLTKILDEVKKDTKTIGKIYIAIKGYGMASFVPTRTFKRNDILAEERAKKMKNLVNNIITNTTKNYTDIEITVEDLGVSPYDKEGWVQGDKYQNDPQNTEKYGKFQKSLGLIYIASYNNDQELATVKAKNPLTKDLTNDVKNKNKVELIPIE